MGGVAVFLDIVTDEDEVAGSAPEEETLEGRTIGSGDEVATLFFFLVVAEGAAELFFFEAAPIPSFLRPFIAVLRRLCEVVGRSS